MHGKDFHSIQFDSHKKDAQPSQNNRKAKTSSQGMKVQISTNKPGKKQELDTANQY